MTTLRAKGRAVIREKENFKVPPFDPSNYKLSMIKALNYYNAELDDDAKKRKFAYQYWKTKSLNVEKLNKVGDGWFKTIGAVAHMAINNIPLSEADLMKLDDAYIKLSSTTVTEVAPKTVVRPTVVDRTNDIVSEHIGEIEYAIDMFIGKNQEFDIKEYIQKNNVKGILTKKIGEWFKTKSKELQVALSGSDKDVSVAYEFIGKRKLKKLVEFVSNIVAACDTMAVISRTARKPRIRKAQPPSKIVAKMKYMKTFSELSMKSIDPSKIVGSSQVWLYNTKLRRLFKYESLDGQELSVKGTTLLNWNPEKSGSKIVRKPEVQLKNAGSMTKRPLLNLFNSINATVGKASGRVSEDYIIVGAF